LNWVERNPESIQKIRQYVSDFQNIKPTLFEYFEGGSCVLFPVKAESDRGVGILLCFCALYQNISEERLIRLLGDLWKSYGPDFFKLNRLSFQDLQDRINLRSDLQDWVLLSKAPGILRSACDFFYKHGKVIPWIYQMGNAESGVQMLAEEVFLMGKTSPFKSKARYFFWLLTQLPEVESSRFWNNRMLMPVTAGHIRLLREFGPLKKKRNSPWTSPEEKLDYCNRFYQFLFPGQSWKVYAPFDGFLKSTGEFISPLATVHSPKIWRCREVMGGCLNCVLAPECPGREEK
jgi:hypothetical protein